MYTGLLKHSKACQKETGEQIWYLPLSIKEFIHMHMKKRTDRWFVFYYRTTSDILWKISLENEEQSIHVLTHL